MVFKIIRRLVRNSLWRRCEPRFLWQINAFDNLPAQTDPNTLVIRLPEYSPIKTLRITSRELWTTWKAKCRVLHSKVPLFSFNYSWARLFRSYTDEAGRRNNWQTNHLCIVYNEFPSKKFNASKTFSSSLFSLEFLKINLHLFQKPSLPSSLLSLPLWEITLVTSSLMNQTISLRTQKRLTRLVLLNWTVFSKTTGSANSELRKF